MSFGEAVKTCFSKYVDFSGRAPRSEFWWFVLFVIIVSVVALLIGLNTLFGLAMLLPSIAVTVRRLHDTDRSGWWYLLVFVPLLGIIILIIFCVMKGTEGQNRFG